MDFIIRRLFLHRPLLAPDQPDAPSPDGTTALYRCTSGVKPKELEPPDSAHLQIAGPADRIPPGIYLFLQGTAGPAADAPDPVNKNPSLYLRAAKELWLEALWQESEFEGRDFFLRFLREGNVLVFQLLRPLKHGAD